MDSVFYRKYRMREEIGRGGFGVVRRAIMLEGNQEVAIKFEHRRQSQRHVLQTEIEVLRHLQGGPGIPKFYASGTVDSFSYLVAELLGGSLAALSKTHDPRLSPMSVARLAEQMLTTLEFIHSKGYLHRDIKPQNFCLGLNNSESVYLLDYGLTTKFMDEKMGVHAPYREERAFLGTASFASLNAHLGVQQSRRDDLESLLLVLMFLMKGKLPWQTQRYKSKVDKQIQIRMQKLLIPIGELCETLPEIFAVSFRYVRNLSYDEKPDYEHLRTSFRNITKRDSLAMMLASLPPNSRLKRSYKREQLALKISVGTTNNPGKTHTKKKRAINRMTSCPPVQQPEQIDEELASLSPVCGHHIRSQSIGILPEQPSDQSISESSHNAWAPEDDLSITLKAEPVRPLNRHLLLSWRV